MIHNYWIKDTIQKEIITKTQIPNKENLNLYANYYNLIDKKGLSFLLSLNSNMPIEKLFRKNGFEYLVIEHYNQKELFILPNENIVAYTNQIASKINECKSEEEVLKLLLQEMN